MDASLWGKMQISATATLVKYNYIANSAEVAIKLWDSVRMISALNTLIL